MESPPILCTVRWVVFVLAVLCSPESAHDSLTSEGVQTNPYWEAYRAVLVKVVCDSSGTVKDTELLLNHASQAEADSVVRLVRELRFDPESSYGRIRRWKYKETPADSDVHFIVPFTTKGENAIPTNPPASREDLVEAELSPWLAIWDEFLPQWAVEEWVHTWDNSMYELSSAYEVNDDKLVERRMVSTSSGGDWRIHPFAGVEFTPDGRLGFDVDGGFVLYRTSVPHGARQLVTGTTTWWSSAEWIDAERFVVTAVGEVGLSYEKKWVGFRTPVLCFGHVDSLALSGQTGPPVPLPVVTKVYDRLRNYHQERYPRVADK